jgi:hypothetical protein
LAVDIIADFAPCCQTQYITDYQPITQQKELSRQFVLQLCENIILIMNLFAISTASIKVVSSFIIATAIHT